MSAGSGGPVGAVKAQRSYSWLGYLLYVVVALRVIPRLTPTSNLALTAGLLAAILLLLLGDPFLFYRFRPFRVVYFPLQGALILGVGLLPPYQDIWGLLYVVVCIQAYAYLPLRWAWGAGLACVVIFLTTLILTLGAAQGLALGVTVLAGWALLTSAEVVYKRIDASRRESQRLLAEQLAATEKLREYAAQAQALAEAGERERLAHELRDSVSQMIFGIELLAQSIYLQAEKDPDQVAAQLETLQELTAGALAQMRSLIKEWRPPS